MLSGRATGQPGAALERNGPPGCDGHVDATPTNETSTTRELIERARNGIPGALDLLCERYLPRLRRWARGRLPRDARSLLDTEDVVQETLLQIVRRVQGSEAEPLGSLPQGYLRRSVLNRVRDQIRRARVRPTSSVTPDELVAPAPSPFDAFVGREVAERYERAMQVLTDHDRTAIHLRVELNLPYAEVASALGSPSADAARMTVARALTRLAKEMEHAAR
jgi:RNA polymerase sigma-70 factor (ECF subfamily)